MNNNAQKFQEDAARICADSTHRQIIGTALDKYAQGRDKKIAEFQNWEQASESAAHIKQDGLDDLESLLRNLT
jgi:L-lactate utilization protein LutB